MERLPRRDHGCCPGEARVEAPAVAQPAFRCQSRCDGNARRKPTNNDVSGRLKENRARLFCASLGFTFDLAPDRDPPGSFDPGTVRNAESQEVREPRQKM